MEKQIILEGLKKHINQRTGIDARNYFSSWGDKNGVRRFRSEYREILREGKEARILLNAVADRDIDSLAILNAAKTAFSGRLSYNAETNRWDYCTGQYFPTEYRAAACALLAQVLWDYVREQGYTTREQIQKWARGEFGRGIVNRWFN